MQVGFFHAELDPKLAWNTSEMDGHTWYYRNFGNVWCGSQSAPETSAPGELAWGLSVIMSLDVQKGWGWRDQLSFFTVARDGLQPVNSDSSHLQDLRRETSSRPSSMSMLAQHNSVSARVFAGARQRTTRKWKLRLRPSMESNVVTQACASECRWTATALGYHHLLHPAHIVIVECSL